jgi:anti-sigma B factor antagonist
MNEISSTPPEVMRDEDELLMPADFAVTVHPLRGVSALRVCGDIDLHSIETLRQSLELLCNDKRLPGGGPTTIIIDLEQVYFIDSAGLALLADIQRRFMGSCRLTLLVRAGSQTDRVLKLCQFDKILNVLHSLDEFDGLFDATAPAAIGTATV